MDYACPFHICLKREQFNVIKEEKEEKVKLVNGNKMEIEGVDRVKIKLHSDRVILFDEVKYVPKF